MEVRSAVSVLATLLLTAACAAAIPPVAPPASHGPQVTAAAPTGQTPPATIPRASDGEPTASLRAGDPYLAGTIDWNVVSMQSRFGTHRSAKRHRAAAFRSCCTATAAARGWPSAGTAVLTRYDVTIAGCSPDIHQQGVVETGVQGFEPEWHIGNLLSVGARPGTDDDLNMTLTFYEETGITCIDPISGRPYPASFGSIGMAFPGCLQMGGLIAESDGAGNYVIDCDVSGSMFGAGVTGSVTANLHPVDGPISP